MDVKTRARLANLIIDLQGGIHDGVVGVRWQLVRAFAGDADSNFPVIRRGELGLVP
jgi:hypothetical protein